MSRGVTVSPMPADSSPGVLAPRIEWLLLGAFTALLVARPLVAGDDPGRLRLTTGGGGLTLNIIAMALLLSWAGWQYFARKRLSLGWPMMVSLLGIAGWTFLSAAGADRYQHPGMYIGWEWLVVAVLFFLTRQLARNFDVARGIAGILLASTVSLAGMNCYDRAAKSWGFPRQVAASIPLTSDPLVGDEEFYGPINPPAPGPETIDIPNHPDLSIALIVLLLPMGITVAVVGWSTRRVGKFGLLIPALLVTALGLMVSEFGTISWENRFIGWPKAWTFACEFPVLGVGPDNFTRRADGLAAPQNSWLLLAATTGLIVPLLLLAGLGSVFVRSFRVDSTISTSEDPAPRMGPRWEFYLGAITGSLLAVVLGSGDLTEETSLSALARRSVFAGLRSLIVFAVFALVETLPWNERMLRRSCAIGLLLLVIVGTSSNCLASPIVLQALAVTAALTIGPASAQNLLRSESKRLRIAVACSTVLIALGLFLGNLFHVGLPGLRTVKAIRETRPMSREYANLLKDIEGRKGAQRYLAIRRADDFLAARILEPLRIAAKSDPGNAALFLQLSRWGRFHWRHLWAIRDLPSANQEARRMLNASERASQLDPYHLNGKLATFEAILTVAADTTVRKERLAGLEKSLSEIVVRDPRQEIALRLRLLNVLLDQHAVELFTPQAMLIYRLDRVPGGPHGRMSVQQRQALFLALHEQLPADSPVLAEALLEPADGE